MALVGDQKQSQKGRKRQKDDRSSEQMSLVRLKGGKTQTSLHELAKRGSLEELKHSLEIENTRALKVLNNKGSTLLHAAAETNQMAVMQYLLDHGIDMNAVDNEGNTALHVAVQNGCIDAVHLLLNSGASDGVCNSVHDPPLHIAVRSVNLALVLAFLEHPVNILVRGIRNCTVLHIIAELDNVELFKAVRDSSHFEKLLRDSKGFFVRVVDNNNMTPVHVATRKGSHRVLELMISKGVEIGFLKDFVFNALDKENSTPIQHAVESGNTLVVEVLLRHGAFLTSAKGSTLPPLHLACRQDRFDIVQLMVEQHGPETLQIRDEQGMTALHHSCTGVCGEGLVSYLFEQGAELDAQDNNGNTALHTAIISGNVSAAEELLKRGSNPSIQDSNGQNSLHLAVFHNRQEILSFLLEHNNCPHLLSTPDNKGNYAIHCALNLSLYDLVILIHKSLLLHHFDDHVFLDCDKNNYLHLAAGAGDFKTLSSLLEFKCCFRPMLNAINKTGSTPLHSAASGGNVACVNALVNKGAVVHRCHFGQTPLMYACHVGNLQAAKALYSAHPFQRDWVDNDANTPLHLAIESGNSSMIQFCLDIGVQITLSSEGKSFFDKILDNVDTELALVALDHDRWEECLDTSSYTPHPMLRLIETMPEAVQKVLNKCHIKSDLDPRHPDYWEEFNFKYVRLSDPEPTSVEEQQLSGDSQHAIPTENEEGTTHDSLSSIEVEDTPLNPNMMPSPLPKNCAPVGKKEKKSSMEVLRWMIKYKHTPLLVHPVVKTFLKTRWGDYARWVFLVKVLLVALHTIFLSIFIGITPPPAQVGVGSGNGSTEVGQNNIGTASNVIRFITLFTCLMNTVLVFVDFYHLRLKVVHLDKNNFIWIHVATIICTYVFLIPGGGLDFVIWEAGALAVFFAWLDLVIIVQLFSILGLYVAMFLQITKNIFKVLLLLCLFLIFAFGFALYILLGTVDGLSFANPGTSFYTTFISLLVANDYEQFVGLGNAGSLRFQVLVFLFLVILAIIMPIVFINLLIGLAVGDIEQIKQGAILHNTENKVTALAYVDQLFPTKLLKHCERAKFKRYPNAPVSWMSVAWHFFWANLKTETATDNDEIQEKTSLQDPQDRKFEQLQQQMDKIAADQAKQLEAVRQLQETLTKFLEAQESPRLAAE